MTTKASNPTVVISNNNSIDITDKASNVQAKPELAKLVPEIASKKPSSSNSIKQSVQNTSKAEGEIELDIFNSNIKVL